MIKYISPFISSLISIVILCIIMSKISSIKKNINSFHIIFIIILCIMNIYLEKATLLLPKLVIRFSMYYLVNKLIFKLKNNESLINSYIFLLFLMIEELLFAMIINMFSCLAIYEYAIQTSYFKDAISVLIPLSILGLLYIERINNFILKLKNICLRREKYFRYLTILIMFISTLMVLYVINSSDYESIIVSTIFMFSLVIIIIVYIFSIYINNKLENFNKYLIGLNETYEKVLNDYKMFKHNVKHELTAIGNVGNRKVKNIINSYINEYDTYKNIKTDLSNLPVSIRGIVHQSIIRSNKLNVSIKTDIYLESDFLDNINENKYLQICESLGVILDNALEHINCDEFIYIKISEKTENLEIQVINPFKNYINIDYFGYICKSSKEDHMGIGIKYILTKNMIRSQYSIINDKFVAKLIIKK